MDEGIVGNLSFWVHANNVTTNVTGGLTSSNTAPNVVKTLGDIIIPTTLIVLMFGVGCSVEVKPLIHHLRKPFAPAIGMVSQFVLLPLGTFGFASVLGLEPRVALGMLIAGTCPGGPISNICSHWGDGDVPLSLTMTTLSTMMSLGMMPLNLWIYSRALGGDTMVIPYKGIVISLLMTVLPAAAGILLRWKWERFGLRLVKVGSICGILSIVLTQTIIIILYPFMFEASWKIYFAASLYPVMGYGLGFAFAKICRMDNSHARTVSLETGIQNIPLCISVVVVSFSRSDVPVIALFPLLYGLFCLTEACVFLLTYRLYIRYSTRTRSDTNVNVHATEDAGAISDLLHKPMW